MRYGYVTCTILQHFTECVCVSVCECVSVLCVFPAGGNSRTCMIAALSPADINYEETLSTLRYNYTHTFYIAILSCCYTSGTYCMSTEMHGGKVRSRHSNRNTLMSLKLTALFSRFSEEIDFAILKLS